MSKYVMHKAGKFGGVLAVGLFLGIGNQALADSASSGGDSVPSSLGAGSSVSVPSTLGAGSASDQSGQSAQQSPQATSAAANTPQPSASKSAPSRSVAPKPRRSSSAGNDNTSQNNNLIGLNASHPGHWPVPNIAANNPSPLQGNLPTKSFANQIRTAANGLVENLNNDSVPTLPDVPGRPSLRPGATSSSVTLLANHLTELGYYSGDVESDQYNGSLVAAVKKFQQAHGLVADGVVGPQVAAAINVNPIHEANALRLWAKAIDEANSGAYAAGAKYLVLINIPSYTLHLIRVSDGVQVLESPVIVGAVNHQTPIFWTRINSLKVSPDWVAPSSISKTYMRVPPGPSNPLGLLRFTTNNAQDIFLHDTDHHWLFARSWRAISHGCIRVKHWPELAEVLGDLTPQRLQDALNKRYTLYLPVRGRILVRTIDSRVDLVNGHATVWPDPYNLGNAAIGALSLDGQSESDPASRFSMDPYQPLKSADRVSSQVGAP
ncbi:hypothetical protein LMG33818_002575 [Halomonadaceae bacterium LMG 33818]|uniref:L,D-transpeptidase family protein n=1 Tax=Cernens ardua TaxID=3402176 RepID=UPI003EDBCF61